MDTVNSEKRASQGQPPPAASRFRIKSALLPISLVIISLFALTGHSQLLFPLDTKQAPLFPSPDTSLHSPEAAGELWSQPATPRIAIIGAGAGGSSAAFFLSHFRKLEGKGLKSDVTVFEKAEYIGGRSTVVYPWNDDPTAVPDRFAPDEPEAPVELGASIFVDANKNLMKASEVFGLPLVPHKGEDGGMGIWDGEAFVFAETSGKGWGWWDLSKMFWRYGRAPLKVRSLVAKTVASFQALYGPQFAAFGPFSSLTDFANATDLTEPASMTASEYFASQSVAPLFVNELVAAGTQVNYGTPAHNIHGLGALVSLAAEGAHAVKGGNRKIFESFIGASDSTLRLGEGATVTEIIKLDASSGSRAKWVVHTTEGSGGTFDAVILAAPYHQASIKLINSPISDKHTIPPQPYVPLHVTFIITNASSPSPAHFALPATHKIPTAVFSTFDTSSSSKPSFNSLNYLRPLLPSTGARFGNETPSAWHVVKMFSQDPLSIEMVDGLFGRGNVGKVWSKKWLAYPLLQPIQGGKEDLAPVRPDEGFYYVNAMERLISTMETETVSAFNVVNLLLNDFYGYSAPRSWAEWDE